MRTQVEVPASTSAKGTVRERDQDEGDDRDPAATDHVGESDGDRHQ
jgi:hypothetical protein